MKAAVLVAPRRLEVRNIPRRKIDPDMVLLRVKACGVCGTLVNLAAHPGETSFDGLALGSERTGAVNAIIVP